MTLLRWSPAALLALGLIGCTPSAPSGVLSFVVEPADFHIEIPASGELEASQTTPVNVPNGLSGPQSLAWILPNFSEVKAGEVIARLDTTRAEFALARERLDYQRLGLDGLMQTHKDDTVSVEYELGIAVTAEEEDLAERFFSEDERVYTKVEIIDLASNHDYLEAKLAYFNRGLAQHSDTAEAEQALIRARQLRFKTKIDRFESNLSQMAIVAPHDGVFVSELGRGGVAPMAGDIVWSNMRLGVMPELATMQGRLYVLESDAAGLAIGQAVSVYLDAYPERAFAGTVSSVDSMAKPKERGSPVNYFEFVVTLAHTEPAIMQPGRQLHARVHALTRREVITVPNQALFQQDQVAWLYVLSPSGYVRRDVQIGERSLERTVVEQGLVPGEVVALTRPGPKELSQ
ncbi:efflux RND transporter periplasmic adaptor subunit [Ferrimonas pelagia]|uniref:Efflux RND transporter periplasmic adaptor subunit n=1 Tax=Ferrimonas pelagia TaxID=1177826 RepID=A0ABP9ESV9_9GAMM